MDESEADTSTGSEMEESADDVISDDSGSEPASPRGDDAVDSRMTSMEEAAPADDGDLKKDPGGSDESRLSLKLGSIVGDHKDPHVVDMMESDDVAEFLPEPQRPPGIRPPYRGLSITIPPEDIEEPGFTGRPAVVGLPGLSIKIWKVGLIYFVSAPCKCLCLPAVISTCTVPVPPAAGIICLSIFRLPSCKPFWAYLGCNVEGSSAWQSDHDRILLVRKLCTRQFAPETPHHKHSDGEHNSAMVTMLTQHAGAAERAGAAAG